MDGTMLVMTAIPLEAPVEAPADFSDPVYGPGQAVGDDRVERPG